jgi:hypothetical protein
MYVTAYSMLQRTQSYYIQYSSTIRKESEPKDPKGVGVGIQTTTHPTHLFPF